MNPLSSLFGGLSSVLGLNDILDESPIARAKRLADEAALRQKEADRSNEQDIERRRQALRALRDTASARLNRGGASAEDRKVLQAQVEVANNALFVLDRPAVPPAGSVPTETATSQPLFDNLGQDLSQAEAALQQARDEKAPEARIRTLELKVDFLKQAQLVAKQSPAAQPLLGDGLSASEVNLELKQLDWTLAELGTGHDLAMDPEKLQLAAELNQERERLLAQLAQAQNGGRPPAASSTTTATPAGTAGQAQGAEAPQQPWEVKEAQYTAFVADFYKDRGENFGEIKVKDPNATPKEFKTQDAQELAKIVAAELGIEMPVGTSLSQEQREQAEYYTKIAICQLQDNALSENPLALAKAGMTQQLLNPDTKEGRDLLRRELQTLIAQGVASGAINKKAEEGLRTALNNIFPEQLKQQVNLIFLANPKADLNQVAKELFVGLSRQAQGQGQPLSAVTGRPTNQRPTNSNRTRGLFTGGTLAV